MQQCFSRTCKPLVVTYVLPGSVNTPSPQDCEIVKCCDDTDGDGTADVTFFKVVCFGPTGTIVSNQMVDGAGAPYTPVAEVPCGTTHDIETIETCFQTAAGARFMRIDLIDTLTVPASVIGTLWREEATGALVPAPAGVIPCDAVCQPYMAQATGQANPVFQPFNSFTVIKPPCCELTVTTDAGTITIPGGTNGPASYSSDTFGCLLTFITLSGTCVAETTVIVNRTIK